jgi:arylsulfatase A-like enzyme
VQPWTDGHFLGEHNIQGKPTSGPLQIYEELGRITLMVRHPDGRGAGCHSDALAQPVDVFATVLDAAGVLSGQRHGGAQLVRVEHVDRQVHPFAVDEVLEQGASRRRGA